MERKEEYPMFGFNVLGWNAGYKEGTYSKSINRALFGGSPGHSAAELIIPVSEENRRLIEEVNKNGKLLVEESTTVISRPIENEPFYEAVEVPCFNVYFSYWGDVNTKKTAEGHRMLDRTRDNIEEGKGIPQQLSEKGKQILGNVETEWSGRIGTAKGSMGIEHIQHLSGLTEEQIATSKEKMDSLQAIEKQKELLLWHVKEISGELGKLKTEQEKDAYLNSERVQEILQDNNVSTVDELKLKLSAMSAAITELRQELTDLGVRFGTPPDEVVSFPIDPNQQAEFSLDYRAILREMGRIANDVVPYQAINMNCSTVTMSVINAGINPELRAQLEQAGHKLPSSNFFFETPQSVYEFSLNLSTTLSKANSLVQETTPGLAERFAAKVREFYATITAQLFKPNEKTQLFNQRAEYVDYLLSTKEGLKQLEKDFFSGKIQQGTYEQLKENAKGLIDVYRNKVIESEAVLLEKGYIERANDFESQIDNFLKTIPYAQIEVINGLDSDKKIVEAIDKISAHIYSNIEGQEIYGDIYPADITKKVAAHVEKIVNANRVPVENFDYSSEKNLSLAQTLATSIVGVLDKGIPNGKITVDRDVAALFLSSYEKNLENLKRKEQTFQRNFDKQKDPTSKTALALQKTVFETQNMIREHEETIEKIKNGSGAQIEIMFPPFSKIKEMSVENMKAFSELLATKPDIKAAAGPIGAELYKRINLLNKLQDKLLDSAGNIKAGHHNFDIFEKIRTGLSAGPFARQASELFLEKLDQKLVEDLNKYELKPPLSSDARDAVITYLNFNKYVEENTDKISNAAKLSEILSTNDPVQIKTLLDDSDRVSRFYQKNNRDNQPSLISQHLTREDHRFIYLFDKIVTHKKEASHQEKAELSLLLEKNLGNMDLNQRLGLFEKEKHPLVEKYCLSTPDAKYLMFKTTLIKLNDALLDKCEKALNGIEAGNTPDKKSKLTLYELGRLDDLAKLKPILDNLNDLGLVESSSKLKKLHAQATQSAALIAQIEEKVSEEHLFESGDLVMNHSKKSLALKNKSADREVALTHTFISKYGHAAQVYIDPETENPTFSHIWGEHQTDRVKVADIAISDTFRVDVIKLISPEMQEKLNAHYSKQGLDYKEEIRNLYKENVQRLLVESKEHFEGVKNDKAARFQAGWADYGLYGGHHDDEAIDRSDVHGVMYGKEGYEIKNKMICSEFVAKSVVAAIFETNELLQQQMVEAGVVNDADNIVRIPLEKERLSRVHPQRLIELLHKEGCLEEVNKSSFLNQLINNDDPYAKLDSKKVKSPGVLFYETLVELAKATPDKEEFIAKAKEACATYVEEEELHIDMDSPIMQSFLNENFAAVFEEIEENPNCVIQFFKDLANCIGSLFGVKNDAQIIVEKTVAELEQVHTESIKESYKTEPSVEATTNKFKEFKDRVHEKDEDFAQSSALTFK